MYIKQDKKAMHHRKLAKSINQFLLRVVPNLVGLSQVSATLLDLAEQKNDLLEINGNNKRGYPGIESIEILLQSHGLICNSQSMNSKAIDLGCGDKPRNPFHATELFGVDIRGDLAAGIKSSNLAIDPIPWPDNYFDYCTAYDFLEHIPRILTSADGLRTRFPFVNLMNEIWRVLKPGGLFLHHTPGFPFKQAFQDPTHVNIITEDTIPYYFCEPNVYAKKIGYGFHGSFTLIDQAWLNTAWVVSVLQSVK